MTNKELNEKAKMLFDQYTNETILYCIDDGNFWFSKDKGYADMYSKKLHKELKTISKKDINKEAQPKVTTKKRSTKNKK